MTKLGLFWEFFTPLMGLAFWLSFAQADYNSANGPRNVVLSFAYRLGKVVSGQRKHEAGGAESEQNRGRN